MIFTLIFTSAFIPSRIILYNNQQQTVADSRTQTGLNSFVEDDDLFRSIFTESSASDGQHSSQIANELSWRSVKVKLEEDHQRRFMQSLKSKPRKLPYKDARIWIQANLGPDSKEEFMEMVANGSLRTPYIPKRPDEYYSQEGTWVSWEHFLHGLFETNVVKKIEEDRGEEE